MIKRLLKGTSRTGPHGRRLGIEFRRDGVNVVVLEAGGGSQEVVDAPGPAGWNAALKDWVAERGMNGTPAAVVLQSSDYQLTRVDRPAVPAEELGQAVRWLLRDHEMAASDDTEIQVFAEPASRTGDTALYVALAARGRLTSIAESVQAAGLSLGPIRIPELMLTRLSARLPGPAQALVWLRADELRMVVCRSGLYCAGRCIPMRLEPESAESGATISETLDAAREALRDLIDYSAQRYPLDDLQVRHAAEPGAPADVLDTLLEGLTPNKAQALDLAAAGMQTCGHPAAVWSRPAAIAAEEVAHA